VEVTDRTARRVGVLGVVGGRVEVELPQAVTAKAQIVTATASCLQLLMGNLFSTIVDGVTAVADRK
jgi:hypothetical protein